MFSHHKSLHKFALKKTTQEQQHIFYFRKIMLKATVAFLLTTLSSGATLKEIIQKDSRLSEFHYTLSETNVDLSGDGPFTVFAPNNAAFGKLDSTTLNSLLENYPTERILN